MVNDDVCLQKNRNGTPFRDIVNRGTMNGNSAIQHTHTQEGLTKGQYNGEAKESDTMSWTTKGQNGGLAVRRHKRVQFFLNF